jgi:hypothetical protein
VTVTLLASGDRPTVSVQQLTFLNGQALTPDDGSIPAVHPSWSAGRSVGDPVAYAEGDMMHVQAVFNVSDPGQFEGPVQVTGTGSGLTVTGTARLNGSNQLVLADGRVTLTNDITYYEPLTLSWSVTPNGAVAALAAGDTSNPVYQLGVGFGMNGVLRLTVGQLAARGAQGAANLLDRINGVWNLFKRRTWLPYPRVPRSGDGRFMTYYGSWFVVLRERAVFQARLLLGLSPLPAPQTTASLLYYGDGDCVAWAKLLLDVLRVVRINQPNNLYAAEPVKQNEWMFVNNWYLLPGFLRTDNQGPSKNQYPYFMGTANDGKAWPFEETNAQAPVPNVVVCRYTFSNLGLVKGPGTPGQANPNPAGLFPNHVLTVIGLGDNREELLDPSYGFRYTGKNDTGGAVADLLQLDDSAVAYYGQQLQNPMDPTKRMFKWVVRPNPQNVLDLKRMLLPY